nr:NAD-dependent epimerase/dehydratase family protein [Candidatus Sigynarchaeum springense]
MNEQALFLDNKHVWITGANGFVGSRICKALHKKGANIHVLIYPGTQTTSNPEFVKGSGGV